MIVLVVLGINALTAAALYKVGGREERAIVLTAIAYVCLPPLVHGFQIGTFRYGVFGLEVLWLVVLVWGVIRLERWWPILASGAQLLSCMSHILPLFWADIYVWSTVTVRFALWALISLILLMGTWETWAHSIVTIKGSGNGKRVEV